MADATANRSRGHIQVAQALWYVAPKRVEIRAERMAATPAPMVMVKTHYTGISRGTERLVWSGSVGESEWQRMRAPMQAGHFPFPVKYGYAATGEVISGPEHLVGRRIFALHPHQDLFCAPETAVAVLPDQVSSRRGTLAANMETALNALWDGGVGPGDKVIVIGAGIVGLLVAALAARIPGTNVSVVDIAPQRKPLVEALGACFCEGEAPGDDSDAVFHTSASDAGLAVAMAACGFEARLVEMSWFGDRPTTVELGGAFHSRRIQFISSQVGHVSPGRRARWSPRRRLEAAIALLSDERLDDLVAESVAFEQLPQRLEGILGGSANALPPVVTYPGAP